MNMWAVPSLFSAGASLVLAGMLYGKRKDGPAFFPLLLVMLVTAWIHGLNAISLLLSDNLLLWQQYILVGEIILPVMIGKVGCALVQKYSSNPESFGTGWWWRIMAGGSAIFGMLVIGLPSTFMSANHEGAIVYTRPEGLMVWSFIICALFIGLFRLEQIFRSFRDPLRYRLKYILIGLGGLACLSMAQAIHMVFVPVWRQDLVWAWGIAASSSLLLIGLGLGRWRLLLVSNKMQISHQALYTSLTVACVCGYVVLVGMVRAVIQHTGWEMKDALGVVLIFFAALGLVVVMLSRHARMEFQQFVARHFFRAKYNYRDKWLEVTDTFSTCKDIQEVWNRYLEWLSGTFGSSRITIWKLFDVDGRYHQIRKERRRRKWTEMEPGATSGDPSPIPETHPVLLHMKEWQAPVLVPENQTAAHEWKDFLQVTQAHVCVPLVTGDGSLLGFCTLSKKLRQKKYDQDDFDLLRSISHHVTMLLVIFHLQEERNSSAKWEAVHKFSGFYLHDLKNLAGSLSLLVQNAEQYGHDPEFQISAMRTIRNTSQRIMELMGELASQSKDPGLHEGLRTAPVDINELIKDTIEAVTGPGCQLNFHPGQEVPLLRLKIEPMKQVLLNLILNARQATGDHGTIDIVTAYDGEQVMIEMVDTGEGMSSLQLENLFQPFNSSKKNGLGVGLFQCKRTVEDHGGSIHIESHEGRGTTVLLTFPTKPADTSRTLMSGVSKSVVGNVPKGNATL